MCGELDNVLRCSTPMGMPKELYRDTDVALLPGMCHDGTSIRKTYISVGIQDVSDPYQTHYYCSGAL